MFPRTCVPIRSNATTFWRILDKLVVKPTNESGGYGILIGPRSSPVQRQATDSAIRKNPRDWIAQPMLTLSTVPTIINGEMQARHVDLRPFVLSGKTTYVMPGGLTRVALEEGSMIVNSSQGGGSKDTWVLAREKSRLGGSRPTFNSSPSSRRPVPTVLMALQHKHRRIAMLSRVAESIYLDESLCGTSRKRREVHRGKLQSNAWRRPDVR